MWSILHAVAFLVDKTHVDPNAFAEPLRRILPCIHCRRSFELFYEASGPPKSKHFAQWMYSMHNLVNEKLFEQRLDSALKNVPKHIELKMLLLTSAPTPSFEVVSKRFFLNEEEPIVRRDVATVGLALALAGHPESHAWMQLLGTLCTYAQEWASVVKPESMTSGAIVFKYGVDNAETRKRASIIRAGTCLNSTCQ
jgi:hypothetical protein